jgi:outer membrane protease
MKRTIAALLLAAVALAATAPPAAAAEVGNGVTFSLGVETGYLSGSTSYHITVPAPGALLESELDWSLDGWLVGVSASVGRERKWTADVSLLTNASEGAGVMEDSDWLNGTLFIFSESDVSREAFSAVIFDVSGKYWFLSSPKWSLGGVAGFFYQYFDLTASNLDQHSPLGIEAFSASVEGPVVTYAVTYSVPYMGISLELCPSSALTLSAGALGGYAFADDEDDHLLRFKLARGEAEGPALRLMAGGEYSLTSSFFLTAAVEFLSIWTSGEQSQLFYAGPDEGTGFIGIENEIDTRQVSILFGGELRF